MVAKIGRRGTLVVSLVDMLRDRIEQGEFEVGSRLPSEAQLTAEHNVSRTVVREAIAALRADGLVEPRQGAGVFVLDRPPADDLPFRVVDPNRVSSVIELLELRTAVEAEAAALAAQRRSPAQEERMMDCHKRVADLAAAGHTTTDADLDLHLAIADATNNSRFREFLTVLGTNIIPRRALRTDQAPKSSETYINLINEEHSRIVNAIIDGDSEEARNAMRVHLDGAVLRYRSLLRRS